MCDPVTLGIASLAATAGGIGLNAYQQNQYINAQNKASNDAAKASRDARLAELARQKQISQQQMEMVRAQTEELAAPEQIAAIDEQAATNEATYLDAANAPQYNVAPVGLGTGDTIGNKVFDEAAARGINDQAAKTRQQIAALAKLSAYGQVNQNNMFDLARSAQDMQMLDSFGKGSLAVSGLEQSLPARQVTAPDNTLAAILAGAGNAGLGYAGYQYGQGGGNMPWSAPAATYNTPVI